LLQPAQPVWRQNRQRRHFTGTSLSDTPLDSFHAFHTQPFFVVSPYFSSAKRRVYRSYGDNFEIRFIIRETNLQEKSPRKLLVWLEWGI